MPKSRSFTPIDTGKARPDNRLMSTAGSRRASEAVVVALALLLVAATPYLACSGMGSTGSSMSCCDATVAPCAGSPAKLTCCRGMLAAPVAPTVKIAPVNEANAVPAAVSEPVWAGSLGARLRNEGRLDEPSAPPPLLSPRVVQALLLI